MEKDERSKDTKVKKKLTFATTECIVGFDGDDSKDSDSAWVTMIETMAAAVANRHLGRRDVLFNCAATVSIINNGELLTNIRPKDSVRSCNDNTIRGIKGDWACAL